MVRMYKKQLTSFLALGFVLFSFGCDKVCKKTVQDFATVQNTTGRELQLKVCKGKDLSATKAALAVSGTNQEVDLGKRQEQELHGGATASCRAVENSKQEMHFALSPESFEDVKLCYDETSKLNLLVNKDEDCPKGYLEQVSADPCTSEETTSID